MFNPADVIWQSLEEEARYQALRNLSPNKDKIPATLKEAKELTERGQSNDGTRD